jgi:protocatechuate 3,4-dioxygenase beta subunit
LPVKLTFLAIVPLALCHAQAPAADPQKAALEGHIASATGEPIKKVALRLQQTGGAATGFVVVGGPQPAFSTLSDAQGNFVLENLDPGRYEMFADRPGYIRETYSVNGNNILTLTAGQRMTGIAFKMTPESAIAGRVTDADGDPVPRAQLIVSRVQYNNRGKQVVPVGSAQALLDGTFRVERLSAGRFYLSAQDTQSVNLTAGTTQAAGKEPVETQVLTYYPSAVQMSASTPINIAAGAEVRGLDIRLAKTRVFHIRGKFLDITTGTTPANARATLVPNSGDLIPSGPPNTVIRNGTFDFGPLPAGEYVLQSTPVVTRAADGTATTLALVGRQIVSVGNSDVNDVVLRLGPGAEITGRVSTEAAGNPQQQPSGPGANARPRMFLNPTGGPNQASSNAETKDDGTFAIQGVSPAMYQVQVTPMPKGTYVKSIRFGNQDITNSALDLTSGAGGTLDVLLSPSAAEVSGTLRGSDGAPLGGITVTAWVAGTQPGFADPKTVRTDSNGAFQFTGLAPGDYRVAAWEQVDAGLVLAPEFRNKFDTKAAKVKLSENSHETVDAPLIGRDAIAAASAEMF